MQLHVSCGLAAELTCTDVTVVLDIPASCSVACVDGMSHTSRDVGLGVRRWLMQTSLTVRAEMDVAARGCAGRRGAGCDPYGKHPSILLIVPHHAQIQHPPSSIDATCDACMQPCLTRPSVQCTVSGLACSGLRIRSLKVVFRRQIRSHSPVCRCWTAPRRCSAGSGTRPTCAPITVMLTMSCGVQDGRGRPGPASLVAPLCRAAPLEVLCAGRSFAATCAVAAARRGRTGAHMREYIGLRELIWRTRQRHVSTSCARFCAPRGPCKRRHCPAPLTRGSKRHGCVRTRYVPEDQGGCLPLRQVQGPAPIMLPCKSPNMMNAVRGRLRDSDAEARGCGC